MKIPICVVIPMLSVFAAGAHAQQPAAKSFAWAYPVPDPPPASTADAGPKRVPGSTKSYTQAQIDDQFKPPDWFPEEHSPLPRVVESGIQAQACGSCHLMSGLGHPESANLAGLPVAYMIRQMEDFKNNLRKDPEANAQSARAARMNIIASGLPEEEMRKAVEWFSTLKPAVWYKVIEATTVPKTWVNGGRMRLPLPAGGTEPLGKRIIELPQNDESAESRDPRTGFVAHVPVGSVKKGEDLVVRGGAGKTVACAACHGEGLKGNGNFPPLAGRSPSYLARQLYDIQKYTRNGPGTQLMRPIVEKLNGDDIVAITAYLASLAP